MTNFADYEKFLSKKISLEDKLITFISLLSIFAANFFLLYQSIFGWFATFTISPLLTILLLIFLVITTVFSITNPNWFIKKVFTLIEKITKPISTAISIIFLGVLFLLILPFSYLHRTTIKKKHPSTYYWLTGKTPSSSWRDKKYPALSAGKKLGAFATLIYFASDKNYFLLFISLLLILIATVMFLSSSPIIAPFIYPIF
jgi:hypothetical protein